MPHTNQQLIDAGQSHAKLRQFLDAAHRGTSDLVLQCPTGTGRRMAEHSVTRAEAKPLIEQAVAEARTLEKRFNLEPWVAPKGVAGKKSPTDSK